MDSSESVKPVEFIRIATDNKMTLAMTASLDPKVGSDGRLKDLKIEFQMKTANKHPAIVNDVMASGRVWGAFIAAVAGIASEIGKDLPNDQKKLFEASFDEGITKMSRRIARIAGEGGLFTNED
jgi:hypothetical protein